MEGHFVDLSASGAETVLAVFLQLGMHNNALDPILDAATASLTHPGATTKITPPIDFAGLLPASRVGGYYQGSLTTPPLSRPINWLVLATPITLDYDQLLQYQAVAASSNFLPGARPLQATDGRQYNEVDDNLNVQYTSMGGLNFALARSSRVTTQTSLGSSNVAPNPTTDNAP